MSKFINPLNINENSKLYGNYGKPQSYTTTTTIQLSQVRTMTTRVKEVELVNTVSYNTAPSFKDTAEFKALVAKLNNTLEFLKIQEEEKRRRLKLSQENRLKHTGHTKILKLPASLEVLIPSTEKPVSSAYPAYQNPWSYHQAQQNDKTRSASQRLPAQGVGADSAVLHLKIQRFNKVKNLCKGIYYTHFSLKDHLIN